MAAAYLSTLETELLLWAAIRRGDFTEWEVTYDPISDSRRPDLEIETRVGALARLRGLGLFCDYGHEPWPDGPTVRPTGTLSLTDVGREVAVRLLVWAVAPKGQVRVEWVEETDPIRARFAPLTEGVMSHRRLEIQVTFYDDAGDAESVAVKSFDAAGTVGWGDAATIEAVAMIRYVVSTVRAGDEAFVDRESAIEGTAGKWHRCDQCDRTTMGLPESWRRVPDVGLLICDRCRPGRVKVEQVERFGELDRELLSDATDALGANEARELFEGLDEVELQQALDRQKSDTRSTEEWARDMAHEAFPDAEGSQP